MIGAPLASFAPTWPRSGDQVVLLLLVLGLVLRAGAATRHTTLRVARAALLTSLGMWLGAVLADIGGLPSDWCEQLWYLTTVLLLVGPVAVLGARRPGSTAWMWFVLLPLALVMEWPALSQWTEDGPPERLVLETPHLVAYLLVLTMGAGNYFGTRHTGAALAYSLAAVLMRLTFGPWSLTSPSVLRSAAVPIILIAAVLVWRTPRNRRRGSSNELVARWSSVWIEFRDLFGIVWAKRVMDRINEAARGECWPDRLDLGGFVPASGTSLLDGAQAAGPDVATPEAAETSIRETGSDPKTGDIGAAVAPHADREVECPDARVDHWMRFVLRRFVDPEWIDRRMRQ